MVYICLPLLLQAAVAGLQGQRQQVLRGASSHWPHKSTAMPAGCQRCSGIADTGLAACSSESPIVYTMPKEERNQKVAASRIVFKERTLCCWG